MGMNQYLLGVVVANATRASMLETWCASQVLSMAIKKAFEDEEEERLIPRGRKLSKRRDNEESIS